MRKRAAGDGLEDGGWIQIGSNICLVPDKPTPRRLFCDAHNGTYVRLATAGFSRST